MGGVMANWKGLGNSAIITLLAVCAMTYLAHPDFTAQADAVRRQVAEIAQPQLQTQMTIPIAVVHMLPEGIKGLLCIILLMGIFGGDGTHLLSWGSLFIQDVILPMRKTQFTPRQHIRLLRCAMIGVAVFAFCFGCLFKQTEYVMMWWAVTEALYVGGAGVAIIGGLYWKKGTTAGAWAGLLTGSGLVTSGILARQAWGDGFPINGAQIGFFGAIAGCIIYAVVSLLTCRRDFDMDRMLHRGKYAVKSEQTYETAAKTRVTWGRLIGFDEHFTLGDKFLAGGLFGWSMLWFRRARHWVHLEPHRAMACLGMVAVLVYRGYRHTGMLCRCDCGLVHMGRHPRHAPLFLQAQAGASNAEDNGMVTDHHNLSDR